MVPHRGRQSPRDSLSPSVYLVRNWGKTFPFVVVIVLAVLLVSGIVSLINSIPLSVRTIYHYSRFSLGVTPRGDAALTPQIQKRIEKEAPVKIARSIVCRASGAQVRSIVGKWPFVVLGLSQEDMRFYLKQLSVSEVQGRLPAPGKAEALISEPVARNLKLRLRSALLSPENSEAYSPQVVRVVGIAKSQEWMMLTTVEYHKKFHFPPIDVLLVFAENQEDQEKLDSWALKEFKGERAQLFAYQELDADTNEMFSILYQILNVVIATLVLVITIMMAMLMNIYQSQRIQEFALLQAMGYSSEMLMRRMLLEAAIIVVTGWTAGLVLAVILLQLVDSALMQPNAFSLNVTDSIAFLYTIPIPISIFLAAWLTVGQRFRDFDPVGIVERRLI